MRAGLATSVTMHALLLGVGMVSLSAPKAFEVSDVDALPVEIIPFEDISQVQIGDKQAPNLDKPAPLPTKRPDIVEDAQKVGEADTDMEAPPTEAPKPRPVQQASEPPPAPAPAPTPKPAEKPVEQAMAEPPKPTPPPPEPAPKPAPAPAQEAVPEAPAETTVAESDASESVQFPASAPVPQARPQPPRPPQPPQVAEKPKPVEKPVDKPRQQASKTEKQDVLDEVAALLNKEKASGGGAKRSEEQASLGGTRTTSGERLSQSEEDGVRRQIEACWQVPAGAQDAADIRVTIKFSLKPDGTVEGTPQIVSGGGNSPVHRAAAESARRAVLRCGPYNLPAAKYDVWSEMILNFDPSAMF